MKRRLVLIVMVAGILALNIQLPSNAQMPSSFSMAAGMPKAQMESLISAMGKAYLQALVAAPVRTTISNLSVSVTQSADRRYTCSSGGSIHTTMTLRTITTSNNGNVTLSGSGHQTIADWRCAKGWVVNGDPYMSHTISSSSFAGTLRMSHYLSGGWKATGPNKAKQSCQFSSITQYSSLGNSGVTTVHAKCVPGGGGDFTTHF